jgi:hypothetical protein
LLYRWLSKTYPHRLHRCRQSGTHSTNGRNPASMDTGVLMHHLDKTKQDQPQKILSRHLDQL